MLFSRLCTECLQFLKVCIRDAVDVIPMMGFSVFRRGFPAICAESPYEIRVVVKAAFVADLHYGKVGIHKQLFGVGKAKLIQILLEILSRFREEFS